MQTQLAHSKYLAEFDEILKKIVFGESIKDYTKKEVEEKEESKVEDK